MRSKGSSNRIGWMETTSINVKSWCLYFPSSSFQKKIDLTFFLCLKRCKALVVASKQLTIQSTPKALVVHLKRFTPTGGKVGEMIQYDKTLDLSPYMSKGEVRARFSSKKGELIGLIQRGFLFLF